MKFFEASNLYSLNKSTYVNLRWIAYIGQLIAILSVQFLLSFKFNYLTCLVVIFFSILTNLYLQFKIRDNQVGNSISTAYLSFDNENYTASREIIQLKFNGSLKFLNSAIFDL